VIGDRAPGPAEPVRIGLLGCGTVGRAVVRSLIDGADTIERASGHRLEVGRCWCATPPARGPGSTPPC
jgi:homoserine dehydrogenase